ncbi:MAG TPA: glycosyltransferase family 39 protein [Candidatus Dormibacteraeota bacterium]|nr:glycosyltransferase family 39 protein [Candidatus Dormibacteraeota bacterium]
METWKSGASAPRERPEKDWGFSPRLAFPRFFLWLLPLSFALQVASIGLFHQYRTRPGNDNFEFGWEMGRVGRSITLGEGFSSPYDGMTGPTAWEPPLYPYLIGGVFKVFGIYTHASAWVLLSINSLFATLTCIPIFLIAQRTFGEGVAKWSAYAWGLNPYVWYWSIHWIWDTTFTPFILACIFLLALKLQDWPGWQGWALFGALYGIGALANPTMLAFLPFCGLWIWRQRYRRGLPSLGGVVMASVVFWAALSPWLVRNYEVFGRFVFIRDDFGLQFRLGNWKGADGMLMAYLQPNLNRGELEKFRQMGELAYGESCKREAFEWVRDHPGRFVVISLKRLFYYWNGVPRETNSVSPVDFRTSGFLATSVLALWGLGRAVRQKRAGAWLFAGLILFYPAVYYFVYPHARYRHPIEPELTILIVFLILEAAGSRRGLTQERSC